MILQNNTLGNFPFLVENNERPLVTEMVILRATLVPFLQCRAVTVEFGLDFGNCYITACRSLLLSALGGVRQDWMEPCFPLG